MNVVLQQCLQMRLVLAQHVSSGEEIVRYHVRGIGEVCRSPQGLLHPGAIEEGDRFVAGVRIGQRVGDVKRASLRLFVSAIRLVFRFDTYVRECLRNR